MSSCKKNICLLKLKFINYVNNDMLKETNNALELINIIDCNNLENIKKELKNIVENLEFQTKVVETSNNNNNNGCSKNKMFCDSKCREFDSSCLTKCFNEFTECKDKFKNKI